MLKKDDCPYGAGFTNNLANYKPRKSSNSFEFMRDLGSHQPPQLAHGTFPKRVEGGESLLPGNIGRGSLSGSSERPSAEGALQGNNQHGKSEHGKLPPR